MCYTLYMSTTRDSQKSKLYRAENACPRGREFTTVAEMQAFVDKLLNMAVVRRHYNVVRIEVTDGRGQRRALAKPGDGWGPRQIGMPKWSRCERIVIHEVAHHLASCHRTRTNLRISSHGWQFAATELDLIGWACGAKAAKELKAAFRKHKVRFTEPRTRSTTMTPEQRQMATQRLSAAREQRLATPKWRWDQLAKAEGNWKNRPVLVDVYFRHANGEIETLQFNSIHCVIRRGEDRYNGYSTGITWMREDGKTMVEARTVKDEHGTEGWVIITDAYRPDRQEIWRFSWSTPQAKVA